MAERAEAPLSRYQRAKLWQMAEALLLWTLGHEPDMRATRPQGDQYFN